MYTTRFRTIASAAALAAVTLAAAPAAAQRVTLRGQVTDADNGQPIAGAEIHVGDDDVQAVTDVHGAFTIYRVPAGDRVVWAEALGYATSAVPVSVAEASGPVSLPLRRDPVRLAAITATVSRFEARQRSYGGSVRVLSDRELVGVASPDMRDFLEYRAGLYPRPCPTAIRGAGAGGCVNVRGSAVAPTVFVDEVNWGKGLDVLATYRPEEIARVEVYGGGQQVRLYTRWFLDWASQHDFRPLPLIASN
jgi:hypothetical protein